MQTPILSLTGNAGWHNTLPFPIRKTVAIAAVDLGIYRLISTIDFAKMTPLKTPLPDNLFWLRH
jgi:hypothetical protein